MTDFDVAAEKLEPTPRERKVGGAGWANPEEARRSIQVGRILQIVQQIADNPETSTTDKLNASKLLLDKSLPNLQSLDMSISRIGEESADSNAFKARLAMLIERAGPALLSEILGDRARLPATIEHEPAPKDVKEG